MNSFKEFWPFYLEQHARQSNRVMHFIGTLLVHLFAIYILVSGNFSFGIFIPLFGYGFAWVGHLLFEKNKPATFLHPIWSLMGDLKLFYLMCIGKLW